MTEKELIKKLQILKQIKPRQEWVVLSRNKILENKFVRHPVKAEFASTANSFFRSVFSRQLTYSFAVLLIAVISVIGLTQYRSFNIQGSQTTAALLPEVKSDLERFKTASKDLALIAKTDPENISVIADQVKNAAEALTDAVKKDPKIAKEIALDVNNNKTYLDVMEDDGLNKTYLNDLYKATVEPLIEDMKKATLTESEKTTLDEIIESHYSKGDYVTTLRDILLMGAGRDSKEDN